MQSTASPDAVGVRLTIHDEHEHDEVLGVLLSRLSFAVVSFSEDAITASIAGPDHPYRDSHADLERHRETVSDLMDAVAEFVAMDLPGDAVVPITEAKLVEKCRDTLESAGDRIGQVAKGEHHDVDKLCDSARAAMRLIAQVQS